MMMIMKTLSHTKENSKLKMTKRKMEEVSASGRMVPDTKDSGEVAKDTASDAMSTRMEMSTRGSSKKVTIMGKVCTRMLMARCMLDSGTKMRSMEVDRRFGLMERCRRASGLKVKCKLKGLSNVRRLCLRRRN